MKRSLFFVLLILSPGFSQPIEVPNPSFAQGEDSPAGWTLSGGQGQWWKASGKQGRAIAVTGNGADTNYWQSETIPFRPRQVYRVRFRVRSLGASGGTPVTGPVFANRDIGKVPEDWTTYATFFTTPDELNADLAWLRFGQWHVKGRVAFDDIELVQASPVYARRGSLSLGQGEEVAGNTYTFRAPIHMGNSSRPLWQHRCGFNSNRWVFGKNSFVVYRHSAGGINQQKASLSLTVNYYTGGELMVEVGKDGRNWVPAGTIGKMDTAEFVIPASLFPARDVWIRLRARARDKVGANSDPGSFQVNAYTYKATLEKPLKRLSGFTRMLVVPETDPRVRVTIHALGAPMPGIKNELVATVENLTKEPLRARPELNLVRNGKEKLPSRGKKTILRPGQQTVRVPYVLPGSGEYELTFTLGWGLSYRVETSVRVPEFYDSSYGELLPGSVKGAAVWWASSGWKISRERAGPEKKGKAMIIRAAKNEVEAAQLVLRPEKAMGPLHARAEELTDGRGNSLPAGAIEILKVAYVPVEKPTDRIGVAAAWPDPLPPIRSGIDLEAGKNQPLWVRVKPPRDIPAGIYRGRVFLDADGFHTSVPLDVEVYDFELPDQMTCSTAFGFSPGNVWRYQKVREEAQRRAVLGKYWANFSAHHISPYDPAPLDRYRVTWPGTSKWRGGRRDTTSFHSGKGCLLLEDLSESKRTSAQYAANIPISPEGLRFRFWYRTGKPGHKFIVTLNHNGPDGHWMSGRNNDMIVTGSGTWQLFDRTITRFPEEAESVRLTLWATLYSEQGKGTGEVWYDEVSLTDAGTGKEWIDDGNFEPLAPTTIKPDFDWADWDRAMQRAIDVYHFNSFRQPIAGMGGGTFHARREPSLLGYGEETPHYQAAFRSYCQQVEQHLRGKGWLDKAFIYWFDEPAPKDYEFVNNGFLRLKKAAPGLRRMLTEQVEKELVGGPNIWCPVSPNYDSDAAGERSKAGDIFWWYVCTGPKAPYCGLFIDHPGTELRVWLWQTWQRNIRGILVWQTNYWTSPAAYPDSLQNPYIDPMGWVSGYSTAKGVKRPWGNGDGRFIYPPEAAASGTQPQAVLEGPVDSIRWEMLRDGIEDYEYLALLRRLLEANGKKLSHRARTRYARLLEVPETITASMTEFTRDPAPLEARRHQVALAIAELTARLNRR